MPEERWIIQRRQGSYPTIAGVVDMLRIRWSTCSGFSGRHAPDYARVASNALSRGLHSWERVFILVTLRSESHPARSLAMS